MMIFGVVDWKRSIIGELEKRMKMLDCSNSEIEVSYDLNLSREEQMTYSKIGLFSLNYDLRDSYYIRKYGKGEDV